MKSLPPLVVRLLMTMGAILCVGEGPGLDEVISFHRSITGHRRLVCAEPVVVGSTNLVGVFLARLVLAGGGLDRPLNQAKGRGDDRI